MDLTKQEEKVKTVTLSLNMTDKELSDVAQKKLNIPSEDTKDEDEPVHLRGLGLRPGQDKAEMTIEQSDPNSPLYSVTSFEELGLTPELLKGVFASKFNKPSKIQEAAIPNILANPPKNFIGQAQSGTGKTAAFSLSMLSRSDPAVAQPQALCICPTRELARQIADVVKGLSQFTKFDVFLALSDSEVKTPLKSQIVIGTPGKVLNLVKKKLLNLRTIKIFVLDEADVMIGKQGFQEQSTMVKQGLGPKCQICLFSATYSEEVAAFAKKMVPDPKVVIKLKPEELTLDKIQQYYINCGSYEKKFKILSDIYSFITVGSSIVFVHTRKTAQDLHKRMTAEGHEVSLLHGADMDPEIRDKVLDDFRNNKTRVLITTNVLARGIDILQISLVINFDIPLDGENKPDPETYLHRIGRSGRWGRGGIAINMVHDNKSMADLMFIQEHFKKEIQKFEEKDIEKLSAMLNKI